MFISDLFLVYPESCPLFQSDICSMCHVQGTSMWLGDPGNWGIQGPICSSKDALNTESGQIIATSHDLTPNGGLVREITLFQGNSGW